MSYEKLGEIVPLNATAEQILAAAEICFQQMGANKTKVEDIAATAGVSRQTVYKYFAKKTDIINRLCHLKMIEVNTELRARLKGETSFAKKVTEAVALSIEVAQQSPYIRKMIEDLDLLPDYNGSGQITYLWQRAQWDHVISRARQSGELSPDLDTDQVVPWLALAQLTMLIAADRVSIRPRDSRAFIRRFIVEPLIREPRPAEGAGGEDIEALREENRQLKDLVSEMALELQSLKKARISA